jgi:hypothetical protein
MTTNPARGGAGTQVGLLASELRRAGRSVASESALFERLAGAKA